MGELRVVNQLDEDEDEHGRLGAKVQGVDVPNSVMTGARVEAAEQGLKVEIDALRSRLRDQQAEIEALRFSPLGLQHSVLPTVQAPRRDPNTCSQTSRRDPNTRSQTPRRDPNTRSQTPLRGPNTRSQTPQRDPNNCSQTPLRDPNTRSQTPHRDPDTRCQTPLPDPNPSWLRAEIERLVQFLYWMTIVVISAVALETAVYHGTYLVSAAVIVWLVQSTVAVTAGFKLVQSALEYPGRAAGVVVAVVALEVIKNEVYGRMGSQAVDDLNFMRPVHDSAQRRAIMLVQLFFVCISSSFVYTVRSIMGGCGRRVRNGSQRWKEAAITTRASRARSIQSGHCEKTTSSCHTQRPCCRDSSSNGHSF